MVAPVASSQMCPKCWIGPLMGGPASDVTMTVWPSNFLSETIGSVTSPDWARALWPGSAASAAAEADANRN